MPFIEIIQQFINRNYWKKYKIIYNLLEYLSHKFNYNCTNNRFIFFKNNSQIKIDLLTFQNRAHNWKNIKKDCII